MPLIPDNSFTNRTFRNNNDTNAPIFGEESDMPPAGDIEQDEPFIFPSPNFDNKKASDDFTGGTGGIGALDTFEARSHFESPENSDNSALSIPEADPKLSMPSEKLVHSVPQKKPAPETAGSEIILKLCNTGGAPLSACLQQGTPLVNEIRNAESKTDVMNILNTHLNDRNAAQKIFTYLMNNTASVKFSDYAPFDTDNPFKGRNQSYLMEALYSVKDGRLAPSDALSKVFGVNPSEKNQFDERLSAVLPDIVHQFGKEGIPDNIRNWFAETFDTGVSDTDVKNEINSSIEAGRIMDCLKNNNIDEAQRLSEQEFNRRLRASENMQKVYDNLISYYGGDNAYKILEKITFGELRKNEKGEISITQKSIDGSQAVTLPLNKILKYGNKAIADLSKIKSLDIEGIKDFKLENKDSIYSFVTRGGENTEENMQELKKTAETHEGWRNAVSYGNALPQCRTPEEAFLLITGKPLSDASDNDIKKFNEFYTPDDNPPDVFFAADGSKHYYKLNIHAKADKSGIETSYQEYEKEHSEYIPSGGLKKGLPRLTDENGINVFQKSNTGKQAERLRIEKVKEYCTNPDNQEEISACIDKYSQFAADNEAVRKYYAGLLKKDPESVTKEDIAEDIAEYIRKPENITEESKKFMPYAYETSIQKVQGKNNLEDTVNQYCREMAEWPSNLERTAVMTLMAASFLPGAPAAALAKTAMGAGILAESSVDLVNMLTNDQNYKDDNYGQLLADTVTKAVIKGGYMKLSGIAGDLGEKFTNVLKNNGILGGMISTLAARVSSEALIETAIGMPYTMLIKSLQGGKYDFNEELLENFIYDGLPYMRSWKMLAGAMQGAQSSETIIKPNGNKLKYEPVGGENSGFVKITETETVWEHTDKGGIKPVEKQTSRLAAFDRQNNTFKVFDEKNPLKSYSLQQDENGNITPVKYSSIEELQYAFKRIMQDIGAVNQTVKEELEAAMAKLTGNSSAGGKIFLQEILDDLDLKFSSSTKELIVKCAGNAGYESKVSRFNDVSLKKINDLIQTDEDLKIFEFMVSHKRINTENAPYEFTDSDMIKVLQSDAMKKYIIQQINDGESVSRLDMEKIFPGFGTDIIKQDLHNIRDLSYRTQELTLEGINDAAGLNKALSASPSLKAEIMRKIPPGETGSINGRLYCNDGSEFIEVKMKKETFERLFPAEKRYDTKQGALGDCWLVSVLGAFTDSPKGRSYLYKLFQEEPNGDILIKFPDINTSFRFKQGRLNPLSPVSFYMDGLKPGINIGTPGLEGSDGLKMIEEALAVHFSDFRGNAVNDIFLMGKRMAELTGGQRYTALQLIAGRENITIEHFDTLDHDKWTQHYRKKAENNGEIIYRPFAEILDRIAEAVNAPDKLVTLGTKDGAENLKYDIAPGHANRITGINLEKGTITIANPWHDAQITTIPMYEFLNYIHNLDITTLK